MELGRIDVVRVGLGESARLRSIELGRIDVVRVGLLGEVSPNELFNMSTLWPRVWTLLRT